MKTNLVLLLALLSSASFAQTTFRVNTDATVTGVNVYHTIQEAHDVASSGDILIVDPGTLSAGDLNCSKTLNIYGRGYYLHKNPDFANVPDRSIDCKVGHIYISADNCKISGLNFGELRVNGGVSGTTVLRNIINWVTLKGVDGTAISNTTISQNSILNGIDMITAAPTGQITNVSINNNLIGRRISYIEDNGVHIGHPNLFSSILVNQNTIAEVRYGFSFVGFVNTLFSNNIFYSTVTDAHGTAGATIIGAAFSNNVTFGSIIIESEYGPDNIVLPSLGGQFNSNVGGSADNEFRVVDGSLLKTASTSGGEVGMFGGATPYLQFGVPATPSVIKLSITGIGSTDTPITATVSAKSNN